MFKMTDFDGDGPTVSNGKVTIRTKFTAWSWTDHAIIGEFVLAALNAQEHTLPPSLRGDA